MTARLRLFLLLPAILFLSAGSVHQFSYKTFGNVANFFESEEEMRTFFDFHKGAKAAEIGAGNGVNMPGFNFIADSVDFYVEDIDTVVLSNKRFSKMVKQCASARQPATNRFFRIIGSMTSTGLPENTFDKIILISTFHEFTYKEEMLKDLYGKLKPAGRLYILETHCGTHPNFTAAQTIEILNQYGFVLEKKDGKDRNGSSGLYRTVFKKK